MQELTRDMLVWLVSFALVSIVVIGGARFALRGLRRRAQLKLQAIEARYHSGSAGLTLPVDWMVDERTLPVQFRPLAQLRNFVCLAILVAGGAISLLLPQGFNPLPIVISVLVSAGLFWVIGIWLQTEQTTQVPVAVRHLTWLLEWAAVRCRAGLPLPIALQEAVAQLGQQNPELTGWWKDCIQQISQPTGTDSQRLKQLLERTGPALGARLEQIMTGAVPQPAEALQQLADQLEWWHGGQVIARTRKLESWVKYPIAFCLVPALNLAVFGPAITQMVYRSQRLRVPTSLAPAIPTQPATNADSPHP